MLTNILLLSLSVLTVHATQLTAQLTPVTKTPRVVSAPVYRPRNAGGYDRRCGNKRRQLHPDFCCIQPHTSPSEGATQHTALASITETPYLQLLKRETPLEGLKSDMFLIVNDGAHVLLH